MISTDEISLPIIIAAAVVVLMIGLGIRRRLRQSGEARDTAQVIAAVQGERDVLRAKHAVEVAELEGKIEELHGRVQEDLTRTLQLKEMTKVNEGLTAERDKALAQAKNAEASAERLRMELDTQTGRARDVPKLLSERDRARTEVADLTDTITTLRSELHEANLKAQRTAVEQASRARSEDGGLSEALAERDAARADADAALRQAEELQSKLAALELSGSGDGAGATDDALRAEVGKLQGTITEQQQLIAQLRGAANTDEATAAAVAAAQAEASAADGRAKAANEQLSRLAYELDSMRSRVAKAEQGDQTSRNEVEKRDALLELRLQRIQELEQKLREQHTQLHASLRRAEAAEETTAALQAGEISDADVAELASTRQKLDDMRERNRGLLEEVERLTVMTAEANVMNGNGGAPADTDALQAMKAQIADLTERNQALDGLRSQVADLAEQNKALEAKHTSLQGSIAYFERENARLKDAAERAPVIDADTMSELKATMRAMAEKFAAGESAPAEPSAEPSLKDRIRAYRQAKVSE